MKGKIFIQFNTHLLLPGLTHTWFFEVQHTLGFSRFNIINGNKEDSIF